MILLFGQDPEHQDRKTKQRLRSGRRTEELEKRVLGRILRHTGCGAGQCQGRGYIGRQAEMGKRPESACQTRLLCQPDDEIRTASGIMERSADLASAQGLSGCPRQVFHGLRLIRLPLCHDEPGCA
jgi:hypothetical protein